MVATAVHPPAQSDILIDQGLVQFAAIVAAHVDSLLLKFMIDALMRICLRGPAVGDEGQGYPLGALDPHHADA
ncbi:hypothetical protein CLAM6_16830 [Cobetia sp. AM6]|nr:hypothetical protein CLAM6_16830 [Cobetia sp. AM6]